MSRKSTRNLVKRFSLFCILLVVLMINPVSAFSGSGSGTEADPYQIADVNELQEMNDDLTAHYILMNDINASDTVNWNSGAGFVPVGNTSNKFTGNFDGNEFVITGLYIDRPSDDGVGLIGGTGSDATVTNVIIENVNITGKWRVGGIVGINDGTLNSSSSTGIVSGEKFIGGTAGTNTGDINECYSDCNVTATVDEAGGSIGINRGTVSNSYATGDVTSYSYSGGFVSYNEFGTVTNCYSTSVVTGPNAGGFCGWDDGTTTNSYWNEDTSGMTTSNGGTGLTDTEMQDQSSFTNWDFTSIWEMNMYPVLQHQLEEVNAPESSGTMVKITSDDVKISGITVNGSNSYDGIQINANNSSLYNIKCMESISGLIINGSSDNSEINRSIFDSNSIGIYMDEMSTNIDIIDNRIISNTNYAISMNDNIEYIIIGNNLITGNDVAFKYNNVNNIEIYFNKIVSDTKNIESYGTNTNIKYNSTTQKQYEFDDTTYQSYVGNFWGPKYTIVDDNHDGINDSSITLDNGIDYYPLVDYPYPAYSTNTSFVPSTNIITVGEPIEFDDTSTTYLASYVWNFGDGTESNIPGSAAHIYDTPGTYDVTLTTTSYTGVVQEYTEQVQVIPRPVADFNANVTTGYEPLSVQFTSTSSNTVSYEWDFGDGTTSTSENPTHVYTGHDVYTVSLTAQNSEGIEDTETKELYIKVMDPEYENNDTITSYSWDFGDGNTSTDESPIHTYDIGTQVSDTYTVTFTATNDLGVTRSITKDVTVYHNPVSDFITFAEDSGNMIVHKDITFDPTTPQYTDTHDWDIQNNSYSIQTVTDIVYDKAGTFIESLYVNNTHTAESNTHEYVIITGIDCDVSYTPDSGDVPLSVDFTASLTNATDNEHLSYEWNFGDGSTSTTTGLTESHTYSDPGSYIVSMDVVHDTYGIICSYTDTQYIEVYEVEPDAMFYVDPGVGNETTTEFQFTDASTGNPYAWYWTFGDGTTSTEQNPTHIYNDAGEYTVTLTVYNDISTDSYTRTIQVWDTENDNKKAMYTEYVPYVERTDDLMYWQSGNDSDEPVDKELEPGESVTLTIQIPELDHITNNVTSNWVKITTPNGVSRSGYFDWY